MDTGRNQNKLSVYLETSFISMLTSWPSSLPSTLGMQTISRQWWDFKRYEYDLFISDSVRMEMSNGDSGAVERRLRSVEGIPVLKISGTTKDLSKEILIRHLLPVDQLEDVIHVVCAAVNRMDYVLTWNCKHIANEHIFRSISAFLSEYDLKCPCLTTPFYLMGDADASR